MSRIKCGIGVKKLKPAVKAGFRNLGLPEMGSNLAVKVRYTLGSRKC